MALSKIPSDLLEGAVSFNSAAPADSLTIDASGNVGIGTSSPGSFTAETESKLTVGTGSNNTGAINLYSSATGHGAINWADGTSGAATYAGILRYNHSTDAMQFYTNGLNERMRIDSSGRITTPYQPAFHAYSEAGGVTGGNIVFSSVHTNQGGHYNSSTGVFTAPVAGRYFFTTWVLINTYGSTSYYGYIRWSKNGSTGFGICHSGYGFSRHYETNSMSSVIELAANDTVAVYLGASGPGSYGGSYSAFSGYLIG